MASSITIKVKFGETHRRFKALIQNNQLMLNMSMLRDIIRGFFGLTPDVDFTLTYIDEDDDVITLSDDNDLHGIYTERLEKLRITVKLDTEMLDGSNVRSSENSNNSQKSLQEYGPESLHDVIWKLLYVLASKATSPMPELVKLIEQMRMTYLDEPSESSSRVATDPKTMMGIKDQHGPKIDGASTVNSETGSSNSKNKAVLVSESLDVKGSGRIEYPLKSVGFGASNPDYLKNCLQDTDRMESSGWQYGPFTGMMPLSSDTYRCYPTVPPFKGRFNHDNDLGSMFHTGVRCEGCAVNLITGPCFKSKLKFDYHLCSVCFLGMGRDADYIRIDCPLISSNHLPLKGFDNDYLPSQFKLDSRFILDVNILDGAIIYPFAKFTKIWRMKNTGNIAWPRGSRLMWIDGNLLSNAPSVEVEIPASGLPVGQEVNIAVNFTAPERAGQYVSYWRMVSPSAEQFGQRVWVLIQVDGSMMNTGETSFDLNLPPVSKDPELVNAKTDQDSVLCLDNFVNHIEPEDLFFDTDQDMIGDDSESNTTATSPVAVPPGLNPNHEQTLLGLLAKLGFWQADLNRDVLRKNEYNLEQSIRDLCAVLEGSFFNEF